MHKYTPLEGNKTNVVNTAQAMIGLIMGGQVIVKLINQD